MLCQIAQYHEQKDSTPTTKEVSLSVATTFLRENGYGLHDEIPHAFISQLESAIKANNVSAQIEPLKGWKSGSSFKTRIGAIARAYRALTGTLFTTTLHRLIEGSSLPKAEIAARSHMSPGTLHMLRMGKAFETVPEGDIEALDATLQAGGVLVLKQAS